MKQFFSHKAGRLLLVLFLSGIYIVGFMPKLVQRSVMARYDLSNTNPLASDKYRFGDLYGISFLSAFRLPYHTHTTYIDPVKGDFVTTYNLRVLGDSYMGVSKLQTAAFSQADTLTLGDISEVLTNKSTAPPPGPRSILVLECTERLMRNRFGADTAVLSKPPIDTYAQLPWIQQQVERMIRGFCRDASTDMEYLIFEYGLFRTVKEIRADITYYWFGHLPDALALSTDGQRLYMKETLDETEKSSFAPLDSAEVDRIVANLNHISQRARQQGYRAVFLSIIPNPVSVIEPNRGHYNHLVERVEQHPSLKLGVISLYDQFRGDGRRYYHPSDSHWNQAGIDVWVTTMNQLFNRTTRSDAF